MRTIKRLCVFTILLAMASLSQAKLAGKNVVLVHGFRASDIENRPSDSSLQSLANSYWSEYWNQSGRAEKVLYWSSAERVTGGIKDDIRRQLTGIANAGTCANGCVFVTHSTGDLVTRYAIRNLGAWGLSSKIKVLAVLDFAGAGGGTELADVAVGVSEGEGWVNSAQRSAIRTFLGFDPQRGQLGVLYDLQPSRARNLATANSGVPRMRFVGTGWQYAGATKPFLSGMDDSVVPLHSACGATTAGAYDTCDRNVANNGELKTVSKSPAGIWYNHFPVIMGEKTNHSGVINNDTGSEFTTVKNNFSRNGITVDFQTKTESKWWSWGTKVRWVRFNGQWGSRYNLSRVVYETLNN
ncbi:hypothetical protein LPB19_08325 [Marinobacter salinisoli]|uniref:Alpha/beta hydrolase n=1 Tax=Marinobacter salinisoli TaxID=2769486 RepID=A0ABX7MVK6_9GAMM|nr:hypothetical protein [Marinobacter salinisoli]QSP96366.1 hypothetical protein LPB19_08325 [Marinobacter salinisoli]